MWLSRFYIIAANVSRLHPEAPSYSLLMRFPIFAWTKTAVYQSSAFFPQRQGCIHGEELPYVFGAPLVGGFMHFGRNYTKSESLLAETTMIYWSNFARTGWALIYVGVFPAGYNLILRPLLCLPRLLKITQPWSVNKWKDSYVSAIPMNRRKPICCTEPERKGTA